MDGTEEDKTSTTKMRLWLAVGVGVVLLLAIGYALFYTQQFHIVRTDPPASAFATYAPVLYVDYNKPLVAAGMSVTSTSNLISSYDISQKRLTLHLSNTIAAGSTYIITLKNVRSSSGDVIASDALTITGQYVPFDELSSDMQAYITRNQDQPPPSRNTITYSGLDSLTDPGVSLYQIDAMKQAIFLFGQSQHKTIQEADLATNTINVTPHDPNSASVYFDISFSLAINGTSYNAQLEYGNITLAKLTLVDPKTNKIVYDSGYIDDNTVPN